MVTAHLYLILCPSVRPSVRPYFRRWKVRILGASSAVYPALFVWYLFFIFTNPFRLSFAASWTVQLPFVSMVFLFPFDIFPPFILFSQLIFRSHSTLLLSLLLTAIGDALSYSPCSLIFLSLFFPPSFTVSLSQLIPPALFDICYLFGIHLLRIPYALYLIWFCPLIGSSRF